MLCDYENAYIVLVLIWLNYEMFKLPYLHIVVTLVASLCMCSEKSTNYDK